MKRQLHDLLLLCAITFNVLTIVLIAWKGYPF